MPAVGRAGAPVALDVNLFLGRCECRTFARIETDNDDFVFLPCVELQLLRGLQNAVEHQRAEIWTLVIGEGEDHWLATKESAERNSVSMLITENGVERNLRI